ncbi:MAG: tRNA uridine-5-carboxymethylaminomethyl(34) synthesis GTPase MnmE [Candidatus Hydrogenedentes bacterium]|nr:tRNA uridine-5-carboxymethylaminomethyl(34) synthesis GTPase MnmE [Candidatus Hydrogenedentota bacterium]
MGYDFSKSKDTIVAISTPIGSSAIGVVRISGDRAIDVVSDFFRSRGSKSLKNKKWGMYSGQFVDFDGRVIDDVIVLVMKAPNSYTGEDVVEIQAHGNVLILRTIVDRLLTKGLRIAEPGEFTRRAFLNGKMDLVQAEAVLGIVNAKTRKALHFSQCLYEGKLSNKLLGFSEEIKTFLAWVEAEIDFVDEEIPSDLWERTKANLRYIASEMKKLLATADNGRILLNGAVVVIAGKPNVGKSSLFNALLKKNRAIVSPYPGTTRDQIEEYISIEEIPVKLVDTAGLRDTYEPIEKEGIKRAWETLDRSDVVLFVLDATSIGGEDIEMFERFRQSLESLGFQSLNSKVVLVVNKTDINPTPVIPSYFSDLSCKCIKTSATRDIGIEELEKAIVELLIGSEKNYDDIVLFYEHQKHSLARAIECIERSITQENLPPELVAFELREALNALGEITGETTSEDILDIIFSSFCIGK